MWVQFLGGEDPQEEELATHSSILPTDRGAPRATVYRVTKSRTRQHTFHHLRPRSYSTMTSLLTVPLVRGGLLLALDTVPDLPKGSLRMPLHACVLSQSFL